MTSRPLRLTLLVTLLATAAVAGTPEGRLRELGLSLPAANAPVANYVTAVRTGNLIFLAGHIPRDAAGKVIGQHRGLHRYTIGQRKGIGLPSNTDHEFFVVVKKAFATNTLHVAFDHPEVADLYTRHATAAHFSWINRAPAGAGDFLARVRYRDPATPVRFQPRDDGSGQVGQRHRYDYR